MENNFEQLADHNVDQSPPQHLLEKQQEQLEMFWAYQRREMEQVNDFKNPQFPPTRIKKIMKFDRDVHMVSTESPILLAKACEFFILELTLRSWLYAEENQKCTLQKDHLTSAITQTGTFDFLLDVVPRDDGVAITEGSTTSCVPFYASENRKDNLES